MDNKEIVDILKAEGLDVAEDAAVIVVKAAFKILGVLVPKVSNGLGALMVPMLAYIEPLILEQIDKIDGKDSEKY